MTDAIANPKPLQKPHPPIWIGASGATTLRLVARHGDVWNIAGGDPDRVKELTAMLGEACGAVGRDHAEIRHSLQFGWDGKATAELLEVSGRYLELGVTEQVIYLRGGDPIALAGKIAEALPELRKLERAAGGKRQ
jgi:alkanesulfonate monooxygenase SsuD/methylene tetrahydromethanopterin reductase-like flavin-dependent oxidoreductase (luciferase family)